eukprot:CAMPEP_0202694158 /NCGR_PEP_ID=MMETSP1385-20130828/8088_1 /ASSEMBLY_ACC=CAM_ASM_000861 /TAXON_ID=933848 /ORGANISM="Elphidium margaritaceum" /LENGTH=355 /DNA_ID=CAMNT_0049349953 /DNA_START=169 /DNA_END=1236 /DNA_ORIENTATION=+
MDVRGLKHQWAKHPQEVVNTEPITQFIFHEPEPDWKLIRTTAPNPRQMGQQKPWQPVPGLRKLRGHTPGSRRAILPDMTCLWTHGSAEALTARIPKSGGRYHTGQITCRHRGGGVKKFYKVIDFNRSIFDEEGIIERMEYDHPNRTAYIALVRYPQSGRIQYTLAVEGQQCGDVVLSSRNKPKHFKRGFAMPLKYVPDKASICQIEVDPGKGAGFVRAAGCSAKLLNKNGTKKGYALVELQSKELRLFDLECMCVLGRNSNIYHNKINWGKAGKRRQLGWRPYVHGTCMNRVDHPHGGGTSHKRTRPFAGGGRHTKWGKGMMGDRTRKVKKDRVPISMQRILKRRPRHFKPGQIF